MKVAIPKSGKRTKAFGTEVIKATEILDAERL